MIENVQKSLASVSLRRRLFAVCHVCTCVFLLSLTGQPSAYAQSYSWVRQTSGSLAWLRGLFFLNSNRGWIAGSKGTLLVTRDGGKTWRPASRPTDDALIDVYFADELNGWIVCEKSIYELTTNEEARTYLMQTTDGGEHWKRLEIEGVNADVQLARAVFLPSGRAWTFGSGGLVFTSRDSGASWTTLPAPTRHLLLGGAFIDNDRGWLVGAGSTIVQTSDGGETWHLVKIATKGIRFTGTSFVSNRLGWAVGSKGTVYRTENGGRTWQSQNSTVATDLLDVKFLDSSTGWAVGAEGTVIYTNDGGLNWQAQRTDTTHALERVFAVDRTHVWAVGFGGTVITYLPTQAPELQKAEGSKQ